jgi:hypothetical protein
MEHAYLKRRFNKVMECLDKDDKPVLSELFADDSIRGVEYYIEVTTANINKYAEKISKLQDEMKHAKTDLAICKQHLNKLKALS